MGTGLLLLVTNGVESSFITKNPQITFFKAVYKKHTNFSIETIPQYFINPLDFGKQTTINLSKTGDLIKDIYLQLKLPPLVQNTSEYDNFLINYVKNLGYVLIRKVELEIGGVVLSREYGEWLYIWNELITPYEQKKGVDVILGNNETFSKPEKTKDSLNLIIPLYFWFNRGSGASLPLVSLSKDEVKIHIELRKLSEIVIQTPQKYIKIKEDFCGLSSGDYFYQTINGKKSISIFHHFDLVNNLLYYNPLYGEIKYDDNVSNNILSTESGDTYQISSDTNNIGKVIDYFNLNFPSIIEAYCLVNYVFLDNQERYLYLTKNHEYLVQIPQNLIEETFSSSNIKYNIHFVHPITSIYFRAVLEQNIINKDYFEFSKYPLSEKNIISDFKYNGKELTKDESIIKNIKMVLNGQQLSNIDNHIFFNYLQKDLYFNGRGNPFIYNYSFSINPLDDTQPYGSLNFSKLDDSYLQLSLDGVVDYQNPVRIRGYAINYNIFRIINGIGQFVFSN